MRFSQLTDAVHILILRTHTHIHFNMQFNIKFWATSLQLDPPPISQQPHREWHLTASPREVQNGDVQ